MTAEERREFAIKSVRETRGDNYERAKMAFSGLSEEQMAKEYGESGQTRAENTLDAYCPSCASYIVNQRVTFEERCDKCGTHVEWR